MKNIGQNPNARDIPLGLSAKLAKDPSVAAKYAKLTLNEKDKITKYISDSASKEDARQRIQNVVSGLGTNTQNYF